MGRVVLSPGHWGAGKALSLAVTNWLPSEEQTSRDQPDDVHGDDSERELAPVLPHVLRVVDQLREHFGKPITLLSSYRSPAYNAAIDGAAAKSFHMRFQALDISVEGKTPKQVFAVLKKWRDAGKFRGGLGLYRTFVHIDTRGSDATWGE